MEYIYLDNAATTQLDPLVIKTMNNANRTVFGNPSSQHYSGRKSKACIEEAREILARYLGCQNFELIFTSVVPKLTIGL